MAKKTRHPRLSRIYRQRTRVVTREIAGEVILVPVCGKLAQLQHIFVLNPVAAFIWNQIDGQRDLVAIQRQLVEDFEVGPQDAEADLVEYIGSLQDAELILEQDPVAGPAAAPQ